MLGQIRAIYTDGWRVAALFPLLFMIPALVEFAQHVVEINAGMYASMAGAKAAADDSMRLLFGFAKTLALGLPGYWFVRFLAFRDQARAARIEQPAFMLWLVLFALQGAQLAWSLFGPSTGSLLGLTGKAEQLAGPLVSAVWSLLSIYLTAWMIAWPLGSRAIGPVRSVRTMAGSFWRTIGYLIGGVLPLMAVHYGLGYLAIKFTPAWLDWPVLALDALVVAWLACTMAGSGFLAARHAAQRKGVSLTGEEPAH